MIRSSRKFIAVLMLLWLPVFTGNALAASVSMLLPQGSCCPEAAMQDQDVNHESMDMGDHQMHHGEMPATDGDHGNCGVCHLACTGYMTVPGFEMSPAQTSARDITPYLVVFSSVTIIPLLPPPLARA